MAQRFYFLKIGITFFLILLFASCEYDSGATAYNNMTAPTDSTKASISFPGYSLKDTIKLSEKDSIPYLLTITNGELRSSVFKLGSVKLSAENNYIHIDTLLTTGRTYSLKYSLHVSSETGSLADIMEKEGVNYNDSTMLYVKFVDAE